MSVCRVAKRYDPWDCSPKEGLIWGKLFIFFQRYSPIMSKKHSKVAHFKNSAFS